MVCSFEGCARPRYQVSLCKAHGQQRRRTGVLKPLRLARADYAERNPAGEKLCRGCNAWLATTAFRKDVSAKDALAKRCKNCASYPDSHRAYTMRNHKRRSKTLGAYTGCWFARGQAIDQVYKDPCAYCTQPAQTLDHIDALSTSFDDSADNFAGSCRSCNSRKHVKPLLVFLLDSLPS